MTKPYTHPLSETTWIEGEPYANLWSAASQIANVAVGRVATPATPEFYEECRQLVSIDIMRFALTDDNAMLKLVEAIKAEMDRQFQVREER